MTLAAEAQEGPGPGLSARNSPAQAGGPRSGSIDLACAVKRIGQSDVRRIAAAAVVLNVAPSTLHRWLNDGLIACEQITPGAPWRIRMTDALKARFTASAGEGFITMQEATRALGVTRQIVLKRVKGGEIEAAHITKGGKTGLRVKLPDRQPTLFEPV